METSEKKNVLFLGETNACRSLMAEAPLRDLAGDTYEAHSAGTNPADAIHPYTLAVMQEIGIDLSSSQPKPLSEVAHISFERVITVSEQAKAAVHELPAVKEHFDWSFQDPTNFEKETSLKGSTNLEETDDESTNGDRRMYHFRRVREEIKRRLCLWHEVDCRFDKSASTQEASTPEGVTPEG
jgi:arsenate reductase